jgi:hypothetical protein
VDEGVEKDDLSSACSSIDCESVANEQRVGVARDNAFLVVAIDERSERVIVRRAAAKGHFAVVPMAGFKTGLQAERFPLQRRSRCCSFLTARPRDIAPRAV